MRNLASDWPSLSELQRRYLALALEKNHGNRQRTADMLGITRRTIQRLIARYNLNALNEAESLDGDELKPLKNESGLWAVSIPTLPTAHCHFSSEGL